MSRGAVLSTFREQGCHAFQADLAADFLAQDSPPHHLLITPAGLGKVLIASLIAKAMVEGGPARRVLVLAPSPFAMLWRSRLEMLSPTIPVKLMHSQAFREMATDATANGSPWPDAIVAIVPCDTARREPIESSLASVNWDLVILAEVQPYSQRQPTAIYQQMLAEGVVARSLLITDAPRVALDEFLNPSAEERAPGWPTFHVTDWSEELSGWDGKKIELPPVTWSVLDYTRSDAEVQFLELLQNQLEEQGVPHSPFHFQTSVLLRRALSSSLAVERTLDTIVRQLSRTSLRAPVTVPEEQYGDPLEVEDVPKPSFTPDARRSYLQFVRHAFDVLQRNPSDEKLACFLQLMKELTEQAPGKVCVLTAYADTVTYLHDALAQIGTSSVAITGGLKYGERQQAMKEFVNGGSVLLATAGALGEESDLNRVKHVVHYDLPAGSSRLTQLEGRFGRINRTHPCRMYAFRDCTAAVSEDPLLDSLLLRTA